MNTLNSLSIDLVTRAVTASPALNNLPAGVLPNLEKLGNNLILQVGFLHGGRLMPMTGPNWDTPITDMLLTLKQVDTGEVFLQSDDWRYDDLSKTYFLHATVAGSALATILSEGGTASLLGEIQWHQTNPFYNSPNGNIGPATLRTSSQNFEIKVSR